MNNKQAIVYGLADPKNNQLRYVGTTTQTLPIRLNEHLRDERRHHLVSWFNTLRSRHLVPDIFEIERLSPRDDWHEAEQFWTTYFRGIGADLLNGSEGHESRIAAQYRRTMGLFATGVTVILAAEGKAVHAMTANGVTSLSLEPTLIIVCPSKTCRMASYLKKGRNFTLNILGEHQEVLANYFAGGSEQVKAPKCEFVHWAEAGAVPRLAGCIGALACRVHDVHEGGDHWIVVGEVIGLHNGSVSHRPLLFFSGGYHFAATVEPRHLKPTADPYK